MKIHLNLLLIFFFEILCYVEGQSHFTAFIPKHIREKSPFKLILPSRNVGSKVAIQFGDEKILFNLEDSKQKKVSIGNQEFLRSKNSKNLKLTLYNDDHKCYTKEVGLKISPSTNYAFIQTDKPVYKPGDEVKFRILVVDEDLKPFHLNNINVSIIDPIGRIMQTFEDLGDQYFGVFEESFDLAENPLLGDWKISVIVDKEKKSLTEKSFSVLKVTLPSFNVEISTTDKNYLRESDVTFSMHAKYSFGHFVTGDAQLAIRNVKSGQNYITENFQNIQEVKSVTYNIRNDLKVEQADLLQLEAIVSFTEPESQKSYNKSTTFSIHGIKKYKIVPIHPATFKSGSKFVINVIVKDWKDEKILNSTEMVELTHGFSYYSQAGEEFVNRLAINNGVATHELMVAADVKKFRIKIKFGNSKVYIRTIEIGESSSSSEGLEVEYSPKNPSVNSNIQIHVKGLSYMKEVVAIVTNKAEIIDSRTITCGGVDCNFDIPFTSEMSPYSTLTVFHVKDSDYIYQGSTSIVTDELGVKDLKMTLSKTEAKPKEKIEMRFEASKKSRVYLLAFDKRLKSIEDGNNIKRQDLQEAIKKHDKEFEVIVVSKDLLRDCTDEELASLNVAKVPYIKADNELLRRVTGRLEPIDKHSLDPIIEQNLIESRFDETSTKSPIFHEQSDDFDDDEEQSVDDVEILRKNFQETWIFETIKVGDDGIATKEFEVLDEITSWEVSAFSAKKNYEVSIAEPVELIVKNEFFVKINLPYSIRYKEVLRLDVLVYNYALSNLPLDAEIKLENPNSDFEVADASSNSCSMTFRSQTSTQQATIPAKSIKKVSFYIRSKSLNENKEIQSEMNFRIRAIGTDRDGVTFTDAIEMKLNVEPVGIKSYRTNANSYMLDGNDQKHEEISSSMPASINLIVSGDYLTEAVNVESKFRTMPLNSLEQKTSKLKKSIEYFRYLHFRGEKPSKKHINYHFQSLLQEKQNNWNYVNTTLFRAYFIDTLASAMEIGALPTSNMLLRTEFDFIESQQASSEEKESYSLLPKSTQQSATARYFKAAYSLIPFLKFRNFSRFDLNLYIIFSLDDDKNLIFKIPADYDNFISNTFEFLDSDENKQDVDLDGLSIAAYAYALNGATSKATELLDRVEKISSSIRSNSKCFKVKSSDQCDMQHTAYAALAYIKLNQVSEAKFLINWLVNELNKDYLSSFTHGHALAMEAVAKYAAHLKNEAVNAEITLSNQRDFQTVVNVTKENYSKQQVIELSKYSDKVLSTAGGHGFCSITTIFENIVKLPHINNLFSLDVKAVTASGNKNMRIIHVCAEYVPKVENVLNNVIYEIEMPSGFVYAGLKDEEEQMKDIRLIEVKQRGTLLFLYFDNFESSKKYCVDVRASMAFEVTDPQQAGVKVYNYYEKDNVALSFYHVSHAEC